MAGTDLVKTWSMMRSMMSTASATGNGRNAPTSTGESTSAPKAAAGGTANTATTLTPFGSPAMSLSSGTNAGGNMAHTDFLEQ